MSNQGAQTAALKTIQGKPVLIGFVNALSKEVGCCRQTVSELISSGQLPVISQTIIGRGTQYQVYLDDLISVRKKYDERFDRMLERMDLNDLHRLRDKTLELIRLKKQNNGKL